MKDLLVIGAGPAGQAIAHRGSAAGLDVTLIDPHPDRPWQATYGAWADELPGWLPGDCIAATGPAVVYTPGRKVLDREYAILDTAALQSALDLAGVRIVRARVAHAYTTYVTVADGSILYARAVVDARGIAAADPAENAPEQTAVGIVVAHGGTGVEHRPADDRMVVMDWRPGTGTFAYSVDLGGGRRLVEETCLAGAPAVDIDELSRRLRDRVPGVSIPAPGRRGARSRVSTGAEIVRFPLVGATPRPWHTAGAPRFGAAGGLMHPATGYSLAQSLAMADTVVDAVRRGADVTRALWPWRARCVYRLRVMGLAALLVLEPDDLVLFFDRFFALPESTQRGYLSGRDDLVGTCKAMWGVFASLPLRLKSTIARTSLAGLPAHRRTTGLLARLSGW
ncbi:lycopene beta-cyclase [Gordonia amarae]|uniref:lycopene cyclase family protein n=1 Tax=Gordonia amarae TaxID=36821 RepID=UPI00068134A3|nr:lycopene cyclase family protein [Gordonia amarae]MCS3879163.1 lycopene beta-cyclase [Gordonia amarae]